LILSSNEHLGVERVVGGDFSLKDWMPALSLARGALPRETIEGIFPNRNNNRGLFAATRFESARGNPARFTLSGDVKGVWVNGQVVKPSTEFTVETKPGMNTIVLQLEDVTPGDITLLSGDVAFRLD
jgi:hypothetical protein